MAEVVKVAPAVPEQMAMIDESELFKRSGLQKDPPYNPLCCPCGCQVIPENTIVAAFFCGQYLGTIEGRTGVVCGTGCFHEFRHVRTKQYTIDCKNVKVTDASGNPILISGVVTYRAMSAKRPLVDVTSPWPGWVEESGTLSFLELQAAAVLKSTASQFPYEAEQGTPSLLRSGGVVEAKLQQEMQASALPTGVLILKFELTDLSYSPEIAQAMLQRQQAEAMVSARQLIVEAAVDITSTAIAKLKTQGHSLKPEDENRIVTNLLTVICSGQGATPTLSLNQ
eukprot:TRINITY_DN54853_c0_g1_i1.p1 TRINITY_DN54853_c0_g1~~TRINITY_DN54853_c0_g1_i1.p1  ORF type:complete len:282 (+),score=42.87 TRINITY_DN54853_c0_g1_i1:91-936(+)